MASLKTVALRNKTKRANILNLPHKATCKGGTCLCASSEFRSHSLDPKTGDVAVRVLDRQIPASVHLLPGEWSQPLPESVLQSPAVAKLIASKKYDYMVIENAPVEEPAPDAPTEESAPAEAPSSDAE